MSCDSLALWLFYLNKAPLKMKMVDNVNCKIIRSISWAEYWHLCIVTPLPAVIIFCQLADAMKCIYLKRPEKYVKCIIVTSLCKKKNHNIKFTLYTKCHLICTLTGNVLKHIDKIISGMSLGLKTIKTNIRLHFQNFKKKITFWL